MHKESQQFMTFIAVFFVVLMTAVAGTYYLLCPCSHVWFVVGASSSTDPDYVGWTRYRCVHCDREYQAFDIKPLKGK